MTKITIKKNKNDEVCFLEAEGHTNYGVEGEDVVCAAASSIIQTGALGILVVAGVDAEVKRDDKKAYFKIVVPENCSSGQRHDMNVIFETMLIGLTNLREGYSDFIEIEFK